jgi:hypothetical protein
LTSASSLARLSWAGEENWIWVSMLNLVPQTFGEIRKTNNSGFGLTDVSDAHFSQSQMYSSCIYTRCIKTSFLNPCSIFWSNCVYFCLKLITKETLWS